MLSKGIITLDYKTTSVDNVMPSVIRNSAVTYTKSWPTQSSSGTCQLALQALL
jgi:hypothetical protein